MTDAESAWTTLAAERRALADLLDTLTPEQWDVPSLCGKWTVREVVAHMMVGQTGSLVGFMLAMLRARGRFAVANHLLAVRRAQIPTAELVGSFRTHAEHRFTPPGLDWHAPLADFLVHRLDVTVPLGLDHGRPLDPWPDALDFIVSPKATTGFMDKGLPALSLRATDVAWSHGDGPEVDGPAEALALALSRRSPRLDELSGPGAEVLAGWARRD